MLVYSQRCRQAYSSVPLVIGGIEASLRRIAHYDYWSDKGRRSVLLDAKADLLVFGNGERQVVEIAHRLAAGEPIEGLHDIRGAAVIRKGPSEGWTEILSDTVDAPRPVDAHTDPYAAEAPSAGRAGGTSTVQPVRLHRKGPVDRAHSVVRMPSFAAVRDDSVLYAHASRVLHLETNPGNARALVQEHGDRDIWLNPPAIPLTTAELDRVFELPYTRQPHPQYGQARIPAYDMIRFSVNILRGCFGGCTFCSITEHEGRIIQNRSEDSIVREIEAIRDSVPGFTGVISDVGGPTANMYRLACKRRARRSRPPAGGLPA